MHKHTGIHSFTSYCKKTQSLKEKKKTHHEQIGPLSTVTVIIIVTVYGHSKALNTKLMERHMLKFLHFGLEFSLNSEARRVSNSHC